MDIAPLGKRNEFFGLPADRFGFGLGSLDAFVSDQFGNKIAEQRAAMILIAAQ
jgi:hypothetical protein